MERATGTRFGPQRLAFLAVSMVALAGCEEGFNLQEPEAEEAASEDADNTNRFELFPEASTANQRDVEAPDVFQVTEAGLWDGRPSLGGVWVAHPDVSQPERVLIKNTANDKTVTGALFRRERDLPGPALQVSSSAASQLGMLAGSPTRIQVVALRREAIEEVPPPIAEEPVDAEVTAEDTETAAAEATEAEAPEKPAKRKWWQKKPAAETNTAGAVVAAGAATGAAVATTGDDAAETAVEAADAAAEIAEPETPAKRKWWQKKQPEEVSVEAVETTAAPLAETGTEAALAGSQTAALADPEIAAPAEKPAKRKWWQKKDPNAITETQLDPIAGAAEAIEASEPTTTAAAVAAASPEPTGGLAKPYVQAGTFSVEANAKSAADKIRRNGMTAEVMELAGDDSTIWRVLVGPATTRAERRALMSDVKDLGFTDAFTARN